MDGHSKFGGYTCSMIIYIYISMHMQNFIEIRLFVFKILNKNVFWHESRAITMLCSIQQADLQFSKYTDCVLYSRQVGSYLSIHS